MWQNACHNTRQLLSMRALQSIVLGVCAGLVESVGIECVTALPRPTTSPHDKGDCDDDDNVTETHEDKPCRCCSSSGSAARTRRHVVASAVTQHTTCVACVASVVAGWRLPRYVLIPAWSLLLRDPRLWRVLRNTLRANLLVALLALAASLLSSWSAAATRSGGAVASRNGGDKSCSSAWATTAPRACVPQGDTATQAALRRQQLSSSSLSLSLSLCVWLLYAAPRLARCLGRVIVRVAAWCLTYAGQWPLYMTVQLVGLVWCSQLYSEMWMLRKGMYIAYQDDDNNSSSSDGADGDTTGRLCALLRAAQRRLCCLCCCSSFCSEGDVDNDGQTTATPVRGLPLHVALYMIARRAVVLPCALLLCAVPPSPRQRWVVGDTAAARRHSPQHATLRTHMAQASEALFKFAATALFAYGVCALEATTLLLPLPLPLPLHSRVVGRVVGVVFNALLYSFYVFDYRHAAQYTAHGTRRSLHAQLTHFECHWPYNMGYGVVATTLSYALAARVGSVVAMCAVSVLYAWHVVCSGYAHPRAAPWRLPLFTPWFRLVDVLQRSGALLSRGVAVAVLAWLLQRSACHLVNMST